MNKEKILVLSEDPSVTAPLKDVFDIELFSDPETMKKRKEDLPGAFIMIDADMNELNGLALYKDLKKQFPGTAVIMLSTTVTIPQAVEAAKLGVNDFLKKPVQEGRLLGSVKSNFLPEGQVYIKADPGAHGQWLAGSGAKITSLLRNMEAAIQGKKNILFISDAGADILGLVKLVQEHSGRNVRSKTIDMIPFQKENLEAIFWTVLQDSMSDTDILYLSNFEVVPKKQRTSIIEYVRSRASKGRIRMIVSLEEAGEEEVSSEWEKISVPSLAARKEDLPQILEAYLEKFAGKYGKKVMEISLQALGFLSKYSWPGNYRELEAVLENAVLASKNGTITMEDVQIGSGMLSENLLVGQPDELLGFKKKAEKTLIDVFLKKAGSEDNAADLMDITKARLRGG